MKILILAIICGVLLPAVNSYTLAVQVQNRVVNVVNVYTFTFVFVDNTMKNITINFPSASVLSSGSLAVIVNSNVNSLALSQYTVDIVSKQITIRNQLPSSNTLVFKIQNIQNPPSAIQYLFTALIVPTPTQTLTGTLPRINYQQGSLVSCNWKFSGFTGSTGSTVVINIKLGNKLLKGPNQILIQFPGFFQDSNTQYLTLNTASVAMAYSTDNGVTYLPPMASGSIVVTNNRISFFANLTNQAGANSLFRIRLTGIVNPPTQNPTGSGFTVSTLDQNRWGIDKITQCTIDPVDVLELAGTFDRNSLSISDYYSSPKITVSSVIPFIIYANDILQLDSHSALPIINTTALQISFYRGKAFVYFSLDSSASQTTTTRIFRGNLQDDSQTSAQSEFTFVFDIRAPYSQQPWDFVIWLKRSSGAYVKIKMSLSATAVPVDNSKISIVPLSTQMATYSLYTLNLQLSRAISKNGKIMVGFNQDFDIKSGTCVGFEGINQISTSLNCQFITKGTSIKWLVFNIGETIITNTFAAGTKLKIQYPALIRNPVFLNAYFFRIQVYYTQSDDSLVEYANNFGNVMTSTHTSTLASFVTNGFTVYENVQVEIAYTNEVYIPSGSVLQFIFPAQVHSFDFQGSLSINSIDLINQHSTSNLAGKKLEITVNQNVNAESKWIIPIFITMPSIEATYQSIKIRVIKSLVIYEQISSGLRIRVNQTSTMLSANIQPKMSTFIDANTSYEMRIQSRVPLPSLFYLILTVPPQIQITGNNIGCTSNEGTCMPIGRPLKDTLNLTVNSKYSMSDTYQPFVFLITQFTNPRSTAPSSPWLVEIKAISQYGYGGVSYTTTLSDNFQMSANVDCKLDTLKSYYRSNIQNVLIGCIFTNELIKDDFIYFYFTSNSYTLTSSTALSCSTVSPVTCSIHLNEDNLFVLKVQITGNFTGSRNQLNLQIRGLISNPSTLYATPKAQIKVQRYAQGPSPIDKGIFYYDISCNQNGTIINKACRTCSGSVCSSCYLGMYMLDNDRCVSNCPSITDYTSINNATSFQCEACTSPCFSCQSATQCIRCISSSYFLLIPQLTCVLQCNVTTSYWVNTVDNPSQRMCKKCLPTCKRCVNDNLNGCLECQSINVLQNGQCKQNCVQARSYKLNGVCYSCDVSCQTCSGAGANNCDLCVSGYYFNNGICVGACPSNKYPLSNGTCGCQGNCQTCIQSSPIFCSSCKISTQFIFNGNCLDTCPQYTFLTAGNCISCPNNCLECASSTSCLKCLSGFFRYEAKCYEDCNSISFQFDHKDETCVLCPSGCDQCDGNVCITCLESYSRVGTQCIKSCILTDSCVVQNPVPDAILTIPGSIGFLIWGVIVIGAKFFVVKLYAPYAIIFVTATIQYFLIISTTIYSNGLISQIQKRLLMIDHSSRPTIFALLIAALIINYVTNIVFGVIFYKYIYPLIKNPRQVDYITIGLALVIGMLTNYRFSLIIFSKMFPKPQVDVDYSSRLTPVHYLCVASVFLSGISLAASALIIKNQYPLTDIFMLGLDILIIELILILFTIWMVSCDKPSSYYDAQIKKYHIEEIYRTEQAINAGKDQRNNSKHNLNIKDDFQEKYQIEDNCDDTINFDKRLLDKMSTLNLTKAQIPESDNQKPLARVSRGNNNIDFSDVKLRSSNKVQNTFDNTDISGLSFAQNKQKNRKTNKTQPKQQSQPVKKSKQNVIDFDKKNDNLANNQSAKKFQTSDQDNLPKTLEKKNPNENILANINEPSSDQIPNLPLNDSVFHERISSQFGQKMKPKKIFSKANQRSQIIKNKSPLKKDNRNQSEANRSQFKHNMKKKNKFFESEIEGTESQAVQQDDVVDMKDLDFQSIIKSKIVVIGSKNTVSLNNLRADSMGNTMGNQNNISSIERKQQENSDFNQEISPSWFNIQNQRFDFSSLDSDFAQK